MTSKELVRLLKSHGWQEDRRCKGSHVRYRYTNNEVYIVPEHFKETGTRIANMVAAIRRLERKPLAA